MEASTTVGMAKAVFRVPGIRLSGMDFVNFHKEAAMPKLPIPKVSKKLETPLMAMFWVSLLLLSDLRFVKISFSSSMTKTTA